MILVKRNRFLLESLDGFFRWWVVAGISCRSRMGRRAAPRPGAGAAPDDTKGLRCPSHRALPGQGRQRRRRPGAVGRGGRAPSRRLVWLLLERGAFGNLVSSRGADDRRR